MYKTNGGREQKQTCLDYRLQAVTNFLFCELMSSCGISARFWAAYPKRYLETKERNHQDKEEPENSRQYWPRLAWRRRTRLTATESSGHILVLSNYKIAKACHCSGNEMWTLLTIGQDPSSTLLKQTFPRLSLERILPLPLCVNYSSVSLRPYPQVLGSWCFCMVISVQTLPSHGDPVWPCPF